MCEFFCGWLSSLISLDPEQQRLVDYLINSSRRTWSEGFCELLRIRDWDINICCFCELASSPSCGSKFPGLGRTEKFLQDVLIYCVLTVLGKPWPHLEEPRLPKLLCTLWLIPCFRRVIQVMCFCHMQDVGMHGISSWSGFGEPSFVENKEESCHRGTCVSFWDCKTAC